MSNLERCISEITENGGVRNIAVKIGVGDKVLGELYRSDGGGIDSETLFDMASVTKILATAPLALMAVDEGLLRLDSKVSDFFPCPDDKSEITVANLLTHTSGIGWKPLYKAESAENIEEYILNIPCDITPGSDVLYSCPGFILLGKILEKVYGERLDALFGKHVALPLGMASSGYLPEKGRIVNSNLSGDMCGTVNDNNCRFLGGVAGNAGIFSSIDDMTRYVKMLLDNGSPLMGSSFSEAVTNHTPGKKESRGLGFVCVDERFTQTGGLFATGSIGHCGHTGQSVFADLKSGLYVIVLSDMTLCGVRKFGFDKYSEVVKSREKIHKAIKTDLEKPGICL